MQFRSCIVSSINVVLTLSVVLPASSFAAPPDSKTPEVSSEGSYKPANVPPVPTRRSVTVAEPLSRLRVRLKNPKIDMQLANGKPLITGVSGLIGGGSIAVRSRIDMGNAAGPQSAHINAHGMSLPELADIVDLRIPGKLTGRVSGTADVNWQGMQGSSIRNSLNGAVSLDLGPGKLSDSSLLRKAAESAGIANFDELEFTGGRIEGRVKEGLFTITDAHLTGQEFDLNIGGTVDLATNRMNLEVRSKVTEALAQRSTYYKMKNSLSSLFTSKPKDTPAPDALVELPLVVVAGAMSRPEVKVGSIIAMAGEVDHGPTPQYVLAASGAPSEQIQHGSSRHISHNQRSKRRSE